MNHINKLFPKPDNLKPFKHPIFNQKFKYADNKEVILIAKQILKEIIKSKYKIVIYSESGTSPLIYVCKKLALKNKINIQFIPFKTPRDLNINLYEMIMFYLNEKEKEEKVDGIKRKDKLYDLCKINMADYIANEFSIYDVIDSRVSNKSLKEIKDLLRNTNISNLFKTDFLFFDEYINAGTILRNFKLYADLFGANSNYKIASYCIFIDNIENYEMIKFSIYNKKTELACYQRGAYPFENRIDIIGYYYFIDKNNYQKVYLEDLLKEFKNSDINKLENFIEKIINKLEELKLLDNLKNKCKEKQVKNYISNYDIIRYLFKKIEEELGKTKYLDYLDQVYELYAPAWSPMPIIFHLDYWQAFEKIDKDIVELKNIFKEKYMENRHSIFIESLKRFSIIKNNYKKDIDKLLEEL